MKYTAKYLPVDKPIVDGCLVITSSGDVFTYDEAIHSKRMFLKAAELFLVKEEFNQQVAIGRPSPSAEKWLTPGMEIKTVDCDIWYLDTISGAFIKRVPLGELGKLAPGPLEERVTVKCPVCKTNH